MTAATLTSKGQITIPSSVRSALGVETGDKIEFIDAGDGRFTIVAATRPIHNLKGLVPKPAKAVSIEQMNAVIAKMGASSR